MIRVLALAPEVSGLPRLASAEELGRIGDVPGVELRSLQDVTRQRIIDRLSREQFGALLIIGHGLPGFVLLKGGDRLDPQWLAEQLRNYRVPLAIIATCWSSERPDESGQARGFSDVLPAAGIDTITMDTDVTDLVALEYDVACLQSLASGSTLRQAHLAGMASAGIMGGGRQPRLTPKDGTSGGVGASEMSENGGGYGSEGYRYRLANNERLLRTVDAKMDKVSEQISEINLQQKLLEARVTTLASKVENLETVMTGRASDGYSRLWLAGGSAAMLAILVLLLLLTWRLA